MALTRPNPRLPFGTSRETPVPVWSRCLCLVAAWLAAGPSFARAAVPVLVLAVANAESFDRDLPTLRYARDDAARFVRVMTHTGLVGSERAVTLVDASLSQIRAAFAQAAKRLRQKPGTFIFYYTGHSDATGLHFADGLLRKEELHALIRSVPSDTRIGFFDGCYSGALAAKGIKPASDFVIPKAEFDQPSGSVFLAATSGTDVAFEVEELKGSLFSHHVVDGLYGAADGNHDGLVTIDELYQHVYKQMDAYAASLPTAHAQKPEYRVDLQGRGALVLSYLTQTTSAVEVAPDIAGNLSFASSDGLQVYRVLKPAGAPLQIRLVPGAYAVSARDGNKVGRGTIKVATGQSAPLSRAALIYHTESNLDLVAKGKRPEIRWAVALGTISGSYTKIGPSIELQAATPAIPIESSDWRLLVVAGFRQNELSYRAQSGTSRAASLVVGAGGSFARGAFAEGQQWRLLIGGGTDYAWQSWNHNGSESLRRFESLMPKVVGGFGTSFTRASGLTWGINFRREFPFATEAGSGDVLAFGASLVALSVEW